MSVLADGEVNVGRPEGATQVVGDRLNGSEIILTLGIGKESAVPLEVAVVPFGIVPFGVDVGSLAVHLPDLHKRVSDWFAGGAQDATGEMCDFTDSGCDGVVDDQQVVVGIKRHLVGIVGSLGKRGSSGEFLREQAWD